MKQPELKDGEIYAGAIINPDGTGHHIILLPGDNDDAEWQCQMDWAKSIGGDLPSRVDCATAFSRTPTGATSSTSPAPTMPGASTSTAAARAAGPSATASGLVPSAE